MNEQVIRSRRVLLDDSLQEADIVIKNGIIDAIAAYGTAHKNVFVEDMKDLVVMPGLVDSHVHINEPGRTEWEGFESATRAAAAGGVTTLVDMPLNSSPVTTSVHALSEKTSAAEGKLFVNCGFYAGLIPGNAEAIAPMIQAGIMGVKAFLMDSGIPEFPSVTESDLRQAMPIIAKTRVPLLVHAELDRNAGRNHRDSVSGSVRSDVNHYGNYLASRPRKWENDAIDLMIQLCREYGCKVHIVHLSSSDALEALQEARSQGLPITVETCPHYLFFNSDRISDGDTRFKCAPPIRENENREKLWQALGDGIIDFIVSDHSPCPPEMKLPEEGSFTKAWGGIASLQWGLPIVWTEAKNRGYGIEKIYQWMSRGPAEFLGFKWHKGKIARGFDADLVIWNPDERIAVSASMIFHRHKITPYEGQSLFGKVEKTFLSGKKIFDNGDFSEPSGRALSRRELVTC